ncbi:WXG100 family type VII secretion target [Saccharopolyspora mangrovi]|uniref:WXG100 family type VII secretion target n=1 Tax=Saccharopolyspora mangrovi TaxID=3082379 RepID=A0ABU6A7Q0_9PSEU|nr:hypothetical protein [Saccharopolyspora sp. S2-29]MEB3367543.1 hypothetical protein [Saccharopolyspora sp. S2-29]
MTAAADSTIQMATEKLTEARDLVNQLYDGVNQLLSWVPEMFVHLIDPIKKGIEEFGKFHMKIFEEIKQFVTQPGSPGALREVSERWTSQVAGKLGNIAGELGLDFHRTNIEWEGRAAEAYKALVPGQVKAVNGVKGAADSMVTTLGTLANAIESFWVSILIAITTFVGGIIAAIAGIAGVVTAPPAIVALTSVSVVVIGLITSAINALVSTIQPINLQAKSIAKTVDELGDKWRKPENNVEMGDGTVRDGDESNWEAR